MENIMLNKELHENIGTDLLNEPIAIVGVNCQFPGVHKDIEDVDAFHEMLLQEQSPIKDVPGNRWDINQYYDVDRQKEGKIVSRKGGFLDDPQLFDAAFFKIPPIEAKQIDPQHRLFLEVSIRALNHANIPIESLENSNTGVYCGLSTHDYNQLNYKDKIQFNAYTYLGSAGSAAAGRLSYFLDLKGPCISVDTACSSSLSALYLAVMALRNQQCDMAIVGGVHLSLCPEVCIGLSRANMLSAMGQSRSFDAEADGYVRSEGCAVIIVKRLSDAIKDSDTIHAVIKSIVMNQDGGGVGMAAPSIEAQTAMHHSVLEQAHLTASDIDYIEAHGTGTVVGDSVELQAIQTIHQGCHSNDKPLIIGALKSNLGHTISASGMAAVVKVIESFKHGIIPANLNYSTPLSSIDLNSMPALIPIKATGFPKQQNKKRIAQVSNFGFTGTNVSAILEEPPIAAQNESRKDNGEAACFVISANTEFSLRHLLKNHLHYLKKSSECLSDICYTLINCRDHYKYRCAIIAQNKDVLIKKIESGDYQIMKVIIKKEITFTRNDAKQNSDYFLSGANIRSDKSKIQFKPVHLPLYVFDRKTYWHDITEKKESKVPEDWCFELEWHYQPMNKNNHKESGKQWLLIGSHHFDFGLSQRGFTIIRERDYDSFNDLNGIIFAEGFDTSLSEDIDLRIDRQKNTLKKLLALVKALNDSAIELRLIVLIANPSAELTKDNSHLDSSSLKGFCKTLCLELPQYQTILIDLDKNDVGRYSEQVVDEINYNHGQYYEHMITYRDGKRLVSRLKNTTLPNQKELLHPEGRYLITGGCGGLGLVTSHALLSAGARELILISRTVDEPSIIENIQKIQSNYPDRIIRSVGLDISDKEGLRKLLVEINGDGLLKGIIHAAGASIQAPLLKHQDKDIDSLFSAKVKGGWYLHELSRNYDLDFFVVYSSISSVFGSNKESVYSGTNSFLDALISERQRLGLVGTAIQWGPWAEVGMAEKRSRDQGLKDAFIHNEQGQAFILRLIRGPSGQVTLISPKYLRFMLDFVPKPQPVFYKHLASDLTEVDASRDTRLSTWLSDYSKIDVDNQLIVCKTMLSDICKEILGIAKSQALDEDEGFFEIGFDSLMMTELASKLKATLEPWLPVAATIAFDYPSIHKLAHYIERELRSKLINSQKLNLAAQPVDDSIAIIGMSCSLPNAPDIAAFEHLLENGLSGIKEIPIERWDNRLYYDVNPDAPGKSYVNKMGLIENIKSFDPLFFGISPREAPFIEPQQRLFLENCYYALEHANYPAQSLRGSLTGVFAGVGSSHEYYSVLEKSGVSYEEPGMFSLTGKALNIIPGRVTYTFDFKGPAISIDTACSSSLIAIHYACNSLKNREIDYALAGGVNVLLRPEGNINLSKTKALSPDGQCKTFDENADGYVRAEGCGVLFLKRMTDALRDKDTILAVIKGSAINNDGKSAGLTVPNGKSQEDVMLKALNQAQLTSGDVSYIEAHGTGTSLGDPIEVHAINTVYGKQRSNDNPLYIGSVKTNIGHLESASGVASLIKVIIGLQKKRIYKNLNFHRLNPNITLDATQIALHNRDWNSNTKLKSAGVSAFGFSGTNAHIILQEYPKNTVHREAPSSKINVLVLSAKSQLSLNHLVQCYQQFLATTAYDFNDICFTAATCRDHYSYRIAIVAKDAITASQLINNHEFASSYEKKSEQGMSNDAELNVLMIDYLQGQSVDWASYYKPFQHQLTKVALPHYTFNRSEFWLDTRDSNPVQSDIENALDHVYEIQWNTLNSHPLAPTKVPDLWVISNNAMRAKKLLGSIRYKLIDNIHQLEKVEDKNIVFLYEQAQFHTLFQCCQTIFKLPPESFILVTENAHAIHESSSDNVNPYHTMANAFWKSFRNELELDKNYTIDLDLKSTLGSTLEYLFSTTSGETQFAVRDAIYVPRLKKRKLLLNSIPQKVLFDREASYLITGGNGGLAKPLMEYLIRNGVHHIIITSRSGCSLDTKDLIERARKKSIVITHYAVDSSNVLQMKQLIDHIQRSAHPLKGVFHLAGVVKNDLIINLGDEELQQVLRGKMEGAFNLHQLTKDISLDLFVLFSSASSVLGSRRQANYAAANGFLDGLAHLRQQQGLPGLAINWGVFHTIGMAAKTVDSLKKRGFIPLDKMSIDILDVLLQSHLPQIVVCPMQWELYFKNTPKQIELFGQNDNTSVSCQHYLTFLKQHTKKEQIAILEEVLCDITADVLGLPDIEQIRKKNDLFAMGMDSLMSLELRSRIHNKLQCSTLNLPIEYFINDPRINKIAINIVNALHTVFAHSQEDLQAENSPAGAVALNDTQYEFWLMNKNGYGFNCSKQIQLHGKLNQDYLAKALAFTVHQNAAFWLNFHEDIPIQMQRRQGQFRLFYEDISLNYDQDSLDKLFYANKMRRISLTDQPLIRIYLYKLNDELHELHIVIPHIIVDDFSYRIVFNQFKNNYGTLLSGKGLIPVQEQYSYLDYVKQNHIHYEKDLKDKVNFWRVYNQNFQKLCFDLIHHQPDAHNQSKNLFNYLLDTQFIEKFMDWHKEKNLNMSTGLIAALHIVFYKLSSQKKIPVMILHNGREGSGCDSVVGLLIEYKRINITLHEDYKFMDFFRSIEGEFIKAASFQKCPYYIKNIGLKESRFSIGQYVASLYHYVLLSKQFKLSRLHSITRDHYLRHMGKLTWLATKFHIKRYLNRLLNINLRLSKPHRMSVVFNIGASFFIKEPRDNRFADLDTNIPNYYGNLDHYLGNQTLWIFFTKDQYDRYTLSINGPLTADCKDLIAQGLNDVMVKIMENDEYRIID